MSMHLLYSKKLTPTRVKAKERHDVDIDKLVKHGASRIIPQLQTYHDLTALPDSRGAAVQRLLELGKGHPPAFMDSLLRLPLAQALEVIQGLKPPAPTRDDSTTRKEQGLPPSTPPAVSPEPPKA